MAAGLTVREERFPEFAEAFRKVARESLTDDQLIPSLQIDAELSLSEIDESLLEEHDRLQPFGSANAQPLFYVRGVTPSATPRVMKERHLLFELKQERARLRAVFFGGAGVDLPRPPWDIAFRIERNDYKGVVEPQMQIQHIRSAA
jgi:single-stranded-DNA-specific exonuclease